MIYLSKILPAVFLPTGLVLLLLLAALLLRKRWPLVAALLVLVLSSSPLFGSLVMRAAEGWATPVPVASVPEAPAVVVLTGILQRAPGPQEIYEWNNGADRFDAGVALFKAGKAPVLVFTGGWVPWQPDARPEGEVLAERAVARGVPRDRILLTPRVSNTAAEADALARLLDPDGTAHPTVILVTSAYHMRRARMIVEQAGLRVVPFPVDFRTNPGPFSLLDLVPSGSALDETEIALHEAYGYLFYRFRPAPRR